MAEGFQREELVAVLPPKIDLTGVVSVGLDVAWIAAWACSTVSARFSPVLTKQRYLRTGPSTCVKLVGLILDKTYINSSRRVLDLIDVANRHTCGLSQTIHH